MLNVLDDCKPLTHKVGRNVSRAVQVQMHQHIMEVDLFRALGCT